MSTLIIIRHGQAMFMAQNYDQLSDLGRRQSRLLGEYWVLRGERFDAAYSGPLVRQIGTAEEVVAAYQEQNENFPEVEVWEEFNEYPGITMTKKLLPKLIRERPELAARLQGDQNTDAAEMRKRFQSVFEVVMSEWLEGRLNEPGLETWASFTTRVTSGFARLRDRHAGGARVALFASGGVMAAILQQVLGLDARTTIELSWVVKNAALSEVLYSGDKLTMVGFNLTEHLPDKELITYR